MKKLHRNWLKTIAKPEVWVLALSLVLGSIFAACIPAGGGCDEPSHVARVDQISRGHLMPVVVDPDEIDESLSFVTTTDYAIYGDYADDALVRTATENMRTLHINHPIYSFPVWADDQVSHTLQFGVKDVCFVFPNSQINSPLVYAPQVAAFVIAKNLTSNAYALILAMRIAAVLFYAFGVALAIRLTPSFKGIFAFVALVPNTIVTNCMVSADTFTTVVLFCWVAFVIRLLGTKQICKADLLALGVLGILISQVKTTYLPIAFLAYLVVVLNKEAFQKNKMSIGFVLALPVLVLAIAFLWFSFVSGINSGIMFKNTVSPEQNAAFVAGNPLLFLKMAIANMRMINWLGGDGIMAHLQVFSRNPLEPFCRWSLIFVAAFAFLEAKNNEQRFFDLSKMRMVIAACGFFVIVAGCAILVELALFVSFTDVGATEIQGVQTRYFVPCVLMCALALAFLVEQLLLRFLPIPDARDSQFFYEISVLVCVLIVNIYSIQALEGLFMQV